MEVPSELREPWALYQALFRRVGATAADRFYLAEVLPRELAYLKSHHPPLRAYAASLHALGASPEVPVLVARLLNVRTVFLLTTERTHVQVPVVRALLPDLEVRESKVPADELELVLARAIAAARVLARPLAVDMTGGTKVMAVAMALAAERLGADLYYLSSQSAKGFRRPLPGSERLVLVRNFGK